MLKTKKDDKKFVHKVSISLDGCKITVLANSQRKLSLFCFSTKNSKYNKKKMTIDIKNAFELQQAKNNVILACETERDAADWVNAIKGLIKEYQKRKIREVKEAQEKGLTLLSTSLS